jgi:hypothetical protein
MDILLTLGFTAGLAFLIHRRRLTGADPAAATLRAAAKRLGYGMQPDADPVAAIHTPALCICAMASAFARMDAGGLRADDLLVASLQKRLAVGAPEAADLVLLGDWIVAQRGGATPAFQHLTTRLKHIGHGPDFDRLMRVLGDVSAAGTRGMPSAPQADALGALARVFRTA